jgi:O-antigen ligase
MLFIKKWLANNYYTPVETLCGLCVFAAAAFGACVQHVASTVLALLFITSLFYIRTWGQAWRGLSKHERWVMMGFFVFTLSGLLSYYNVEDTNQYVKQMGRYIRFSMIVPVYLLLVKHDVRVYKYLMAGIVFSGPVFLFTAYLNIQDASWTPEIGVTGQYYRILFGNIAVLNAIIMAVYVLIGKASMIIRLIVIGSMFCAFYASFLSVARGGWIALVFCVPLLLYVIINKPAINKRRTVRKVAAMLALLTLIVIFTPTKQIVVDRVDKAVSEVKLFSSGENRDTSIGRRLALWSVAFDVWQKHPIIGSGPGDFDEDFRASQKTGLYREVEVHGNVHSIYFHSLSTTGIVGFIALIFSLIILPFILFKVVNSRQTDVVGLTGMCFIFSFAAFGLTESWTLRAPFMSMYLAYFVALMSSSPRLEVSGQEGRKAS